MDANPRGTAVVVGLGLIGASFAGALRRTGRWASVVGVDVAPEACRRALAEGLVDEATDDAERAIRGARLVVLATHVSHLVEAIGTLGPKLEPGALLLDLGSTKAAVVAAMDGLPDGVRAVGGHPMTGRRSAAAVGAEARLFEEKAFFLVPTRHTTPAVLAEAEALVRGVGGRPVVVDATRHDRLVAFVSHLPRLLPVALTLAAENAADPLLWEVAAGGFRDATRPAGDPVAMWRDVLATNPAGLAEAIRALSTELGALSALVEAGDADGIEAALSRAAELVATHLGPPGPR